MKILRLHLKGNLKKGIYRSLVFNAYEALQSELLDQYSTPTRHPSPCFDSLLGENLIELDAAKEGFFGPNLTNYNFFFGFKDRRQLRAWFYNDEILERMAEFVAISEVEAGTVAEGNAQVAFDITTVTKSKEFPLLKYLERKPKKQKK